MGRGTSSPATGLAWAMVNGASGLVCVDFLGLTICLAERTGFGGSRGLAGAILTGATIFTAAPVFGVEIVCIGDDTGLGAAEAFTALAGLSTITFIWTGTMSGIMALAIFLSSLPAVWLGCMRLVFIIGAVVDCPQSVHTSLYSASLRPHFLQNGNIFTLMLFRGNWRGRL